MITIEVMGGIGNQLFQIFNLIAYCLTYKVPFYFQNKNNTRIDRPFYWENFFSSLKPFLKTIQDRNIPLYKEPDFHYNTITPFNLINKTFKFFGYFQSYKYFQEKEEDIFRFIKLNEQKEYIRNKYIEMYDFNNIISLHFRIGDYKNLQEHHPVMNVSYYTSAMHHIIKTVERNDWKLLYFYEEQDKEIVDNNIKTLQREFENLTFIPIDTTIVDYEQLLLMSLCHHNIIANSSFSWWGAYFNQNSSKIVTYPSKWFGPAQGNKKTNDLFPESWNKIEV